jgi:hypothetical protein
VVVRDAVYCQRVRIKKLLAILNAELAMHDRTKLSFLKLDAISQSGGTRLEEQR